MRAALLVLAGCSGAPGALALGEPIRVPAGTFVEGPLPGADPDDGAPIDPPGITFVETANDLVRLGQAGRRITGRATPDAVAVGIAFDGLGTGYWVSPLGPPDPTAGNELTWALDTTIGWDLPLGPAALEVVAIDEAGNAGRRRRHSVCVRADLIDDAASCDPALKPPNRVIALEWDAPVDLDLRVLTPDGKLVDARHPTTIAHEPPITSAELKAPGVGILDRDSNAGCRIDGINREALVWQTAPAAGTYVVYANLIDACGVGFVNFRASLYEADGSSLVEVRHQEGRLPAGAASGGRGAGLFLLQLAL